MFGKGVLSGMGLSVSSDGLLIVMDAGQFMTKDGVVISNNDSREITFPRTADPKLYTVSAVHTWEAIQAGKGSSLELREVTVGGSPIFSDTVTDSDGNIEGTVAGWINYPGGSVDPTAAMIFEPASLKIDTLMTDGSAADESVGLHTPIDKSSPYTNVPGMLVETHSDISVAHSIGGSLLPISTWTNNSGASSRDLDFTLTPDKPTVHRPKSVEVDVEAPGPTTMTVSTIVDGVLTAISTLPGPLSGKYVFRIADTEFPESPMVSGTSWGIKVNLSISPTQIVAMTRISVDAGPKPLEP